MVMPINKSDKSYPSDTIRELTIRHAQVFETELWGGAETPVLIR